MANKADTNQSPKEKRKESLRGLVGAVLIALTIRWGLFEAYVIPSGSMLPTLLINDHIFVNKLIFGLRVPFSKTWLLQFREPKRGEIVVFKDPRDPGTMLIKRVIGVPGDKVSYHDNQLFINDKKMDEQPSTDNWALDMVKDSELENARSSHMHSTEDLEGLKHSVLHRPGQIERDFAETVVPPGSLYMMGDHRDNSADSRWWGFAPIENVVGRASFVWLSCADTIPLIDMGCNPLSVHWSRFLHMVE